MKIRTKAPVRTLDQLIQVRCNEQFLALLDEWRRREPDLPTRAEAIRRIVSERLKHDRITPKAHA